MGTYISVTADCAYSDDWRLCCDNSVWNLLQRLVHNSWKWIVVRGAEFVKQWDGTGRQTVYWCPIHYIVTHASLTQTLAPASFTHKHYMVVTTGTKVLRYGCM